MANKKNFLNFLYIQRFFLFISVIILIVILPVSAEKPVANFTQKIDYTMDLPVSVYFYDQSSGNPEYYMWDFGDGSYTIERNPIHKYKNDGTYNVSLKVTNSEGTDKIRKSIEVYPDYPANPPQMLAEHFRMEKATQQGTEYSPPNTAFDNIFLIFGSLFSNIPYLIGILFVAGICILLIVRATE